MKNQFMERLQSPPRLSKRDLLITLLAALIWTAAVLSRSYVIQAHCVKNPQSCIAHAVLPADQPGLGLESPKADEYSYFTQNFSGLLAFTTPLIWNGALGVLGRITPAAALAQAGTDLLLIIQTVCWNGIANETARALVQRPRPFVINDPGRGDNPSNYTSFYSGHTSFAATANMALLLVLFSRGAPTLLLILMGSLGQALIISTASYRILAGRHHLTDVVAGALAGALIALLVAYRYRPARPDSA